MYHFLDLTADQKHQRRYLLDWYGSLAQISIFAPLLVLQCFFLIAWLNRKWGGQGQQETPSSPHVKRERLNGNQRTRNVRTTAHRLLWWPGNSLDLAGHHLGTKGEVLAAVLWTAWLLLLCIVQTGDGKLDMTVISHSHRL